MKTHIFGIRTHHPTSCGLTYEEATARGTLSITDKVLQSDCIPCVAAECKTLEAELRIYQKHLMTLRLKEMGT